MFDLRSANETRSILLSSRPSRRFSWRTTEPKRCERYLWRDGPPQVFGGRLLVAFWHLAEQQLPLRRRDVLCHGGVLRSQVRRCEVPTERTEDSYCSVCVCMHTVHICMHMCGDGAARRYNVLHGVV